MYVFFSFIIIKPLCQLNLVFVARNTTKCLVWTRNQVLYTVNGFLMEYFKCGFFFSRRKKYENPNIYWNRIIQFAFDWLFYKFWLDFVNIFFFSNFVRSFEPPNNLLDSLFWMCCICLVICICCNEIATANEENRKHKHIMPSMQVRICAVPSKASLGLKFQFVLWNIRYLTRSVESFEFLPCQSGSKIASTCTFLKIDTRHCLPFLFLTLKTL